MATDPVDQALSKRDEARLHALEVEAEEMRRRIVGLIVALGVLAVVIVLVAVLNA
jgi:hypothetical protein